MSSRSQKILVRSVVEPLNERIEASLKVRQLGSEVLGLRTESAHFRAHRMDFGTEVDVLGLVAYLRTSMALDRHGSGITQQPHGCHRGVRRHVVIVRKLPVRRKRLPRSEVTRLDPSQ